METDNNAKKTPIVESQFYQNLFNEAHNVGIDRAISFCESQKQIYAMIDPRSPVPMVIDSIIKTLHHFKKPVHDEDAEKVNILAGTKTE
jgi:hypothetical protein